MPGPVPGMHVFRADELRKKPVEGGRGAGNGYAALLAGGNDKTA